MNNGTMPLIIGDTLAATEQAASFEISAGPYVVRLARTEQERDRALQLRFNVFNLELGEGLESAYQTGRDEDLFDALCDHLIALNTTTQQIVGTYRLQTAEIAARGYGFYSAIEFDLDQLPPAIAQSSVELGRACIARSDRTPFVLLLLWQGVAAYLRQHEKRYLFGCCSLNSQSPAEAWQAFTHLAEHGHLHPSLRLPPHQAYACETQQAGPGAGFQLPRLFRTYLRYGAKVCSLPAIDRAFKTIDFFVMLDSEALDDQARALFFRV